MKSLLIAGIHPWNIRLAEDFRRKQKKYQVHIVTSQEKLTCELLNQLQPEYVFFPHWSWVIPEEIYKNFSCVVFHMTDLPFGRGGSPLQNLIAKGITETKISAIKATKGIDAGPVYCKEPLSLYGGAEEIYMRASELIFTKMIPCILKEHPLPIPQQGVVTEFSRRTPDMSEITSKMTMRQIFDFIRMLDVQGYPSAFLRFGTYIFEFSRPKETCDGILADVRIRESDFDDTYL